MRALLRKPNLAVPQPVSRAPGRGSVASVKPPAARSGLDLSGVPVTASARGFLEPRFGDDFHPAPVNRTGLPDRLKAAVETLSGHSLDRVKVHYNSAQPARVDAMAYAHGIDIHVAPGQERHLPHEAWHVVQQAQGRVKPTMQMKDGVPVNDDEGLEREADVMGARALASAPHRPDGRVRSAGEPPAGVIQRNSRTHRNVTYNTSPFTYKNETQDRERVTSVIIRGFGAREAGGPEDPISFRRPDRVYDPIEGYARGHVVAHQFGGSNASDNIVPMLQKFNVGEWLKEEEVIEEQLKARQEVTVELDYAANDPRVPESLTVRSGAAAKTLHHSVPDRPALTDADNEVLETNKAVRGNQRHADQQLDLAKVRGQVPDYYKKSPYYVLDVAWLTGVPGFRGSPGARRPVMAWQGDMVIRYNNRLNGEIQSDAWVGGNSKEKHRVLKEGGRLDRPEVDHLITAVSGGANYFTNFRLISHELNNSEQRNVPLNQKEVKWVTPNKRSVASDQEVPEALGAKRSRRT